MDVLDDCIRSEEKKYCCTCKWYAEFEGVCCNGDSEYRGDFRTNEHIRLPGISSGYGRGE